MITSRGCPRRCRNCLVPSRDGPLRELPITSGWLVQDNNLLACSWDHFRAVLDMLRREQHRAEFVGGLDVSLLTAGHVHELSLLTPRPVVWFAYDTPADYEEVRFAVKLRGRGPAKRRVATVATPVGPSGDHCGQEASLAASSAGRAGIVRLWAHYPRLLAQVQVALLEKGNDNREAKLWQTVGQCWTRLRS